MAFIVEDGNGLPNANSFVSEDEFKSYCAERGYAAATWESDRIQKNLIKATSFCAAKYRARFVGRRKTDSQSLPWPRLGGYFQEGAQEVANSSLGIVLPGFSIADNVVPSCVKQAVCEFAVIADTNDLIPNVKPGKPNVTKKKIGPIELDYDANSSMNIALPIWPFPHMLLKPVLKASSMNIAMVRS